jgi:hypothetical protein
MLKPLSTWRAYIQPGNRPLFAQSGPAKGLLRAHALALKGLNAASAALFVFAPKQPADAASRES